MADMKKVYNDLIIINLYEENGRILKTYPGDLEWKIKGLFLTFTVCF